LDPPPPSPPRLGLVVVVVEGGAVVVVVGGAVVVVVDGAVVVLVVGGAVVVVVVAWFGVTPGFAGDAGATAPATADPADGAAAIRTAWGAGAAADPLGCGLASWARAKPRSCWRCDSRALRPTARW
jgi:hypothetical protein